MMHIEISATADIDWLVAALADADEDLSRIRAVISDPMSSSYAVMADGESVGALTIHWHHGQSEIIYIAVAANQRGSGVGKSILAWVADEARRRKISTVRVGTADASLGTIAFYMKSGYRMDSVRRDFFAYFREPVYENGIQIRDMLVLRLDVELSE